jgi:hypothetical protein
VGVSSDQRPVSPSPQFLPKCGAAPVGYLQGYAMTAGHTLTVVRLRLPHRYVAVYTRKRRCVATFPRVLSPTNQEYSARATAKVKPYLGIAAIAA